MLQSDPDIRLSSTTRPLFEISDIYVALESKRSTSSLADFCSPSYQNMFKAYYDKAFVSGGRDDVLMAVSISSDLFTEGCANNTASVSKVEDCKECFEEKKESKKRPGTCCFNCQCTETTLWRRIAGELMCNPCALYYKLHGCNRPQELLNTQIKRRKRRPQNSF